MMQRSNQFRGNSILCSPIVVILLLVVITNEQDYFVKLVNANRLLAESLSLNQARTNNNQNLHQLDNSMLDNGQYLRRVRRAALQQMETPLADLLINSARKQESAYRKQLNYQLSDLLAKAENDKSFEKALLSALFQQQQQQQQSAASGNSNSLNYYPTDTDTTNGPIRQTDLANIAAKLAAISDNSAQYLSQNDLATDLGPSADFTSDSGVQLFTNKRSMLPCNFNAVSCAKNPFRKF